ncbi:hypothetical protein Tco_0006927 [Tanacetum coccineum]
MRVLTRLIDDLLALDSIVRFGSRNRRLELTATCSISTNSEGLTVFIDVEFLSPKPPVSYAIDRIDVIFAFTLTHNDGTYFSKAEILVKEDLWFDRKDVVLMKGSLTKLKAGPSRSALQSFFFPVHLQNHLMNDPISYVLHGLSRSGIGLTSSGRYLGMWSVVSVRNIIEVIPFILHWNVICRLLQKCLDSGSDLCIDESAPASLVLVICHPVEEVIEADPEAAEYDLLLFVDLPWMKILGSSFSDVSSSGESGNELLVLQLQSLSLPTTSCTLEFQASSPSPFSIFLKLLQIHLLSPVRLTLGKVSLSGEELAYIVCTRIAGTFAEAVNAWKKLVLLRMSTDI